MPIHIEPTQKSHIGQMFVAVENQYRMALVAFDTACWDVLTYSRKHFDHRFSVHPGRGISAAINAMSDPENVQRMALEAVRESTRQRFMQLLWQRSELLKLLGTSSWGDKPWALS